jgi:tRNA G46 methylase TrmB
MSERQYGMSRGRVFPADQAKSLLNPLRRLVQSPRRTAGVLELRDDAVMLELGSGPGFFTPHLAQRVRRGSLLAMDL